MTENIETPFDIIRKNIPLMSDNDFIEAEQIFADEYVKRRVAIIKEGRAKVLEMAEKYRLDVDIKTELPQEKVRKPIGRAEPKYFNPDDPTQTWSGRGLKPKWLNEKLAQGHALESLQL